MSDFTFVVEKKEIHAHKLILMMRCQYFANMFKGKWKESLSNTIVIKKNAEDIIFTAEFVKEMESKEFRDLFKSVLYTISTCDGCKEVLVQDAQS